MREATLHLRSPKKTPPRVLKGHPWVFAGEVASLLPKDYSGESVYLRDAQGRFLGSGIYNGNSQIVWRRFSFDRVTLSNDFLLSSLKRSIALRKGAPVARLVWSEADYLPGLIVDRFHNILVVQAQTLAMDQRLDVISKHLKALLPNTQEILFRSDAPSRTYEGLSLHTKTLSGQALAPNWYSIDGIDYFLDLQNGQKTGFYLDQRFEHQRIASLCQGKDLLDGFCNQGAFALQAAKAGAKSILAIDSSESCITAAKKNAEKNTLSQIRFECANMFDYLSGNHDATFDVIVLDPPSFARNKAALEGAMRGYKELNLRALSRLRAGGILASYVCSYNVSLEMLHTSMADAAADLRKSVRLLTDTGQPSDHPVLLTFPESAYLKGMVVQVD